MYCARGESEAECVRQIEVRFPPFHSFVVVLRAAYCAVGLICVEYLLSILSGTRTCTIPFSYPTRYQYQFLGLLTESASVALHFRLSGLVRCIGICDGLEWSQGAVKAPGLHPLSIVRKVDAHRGSHAASSCHVLTCYSKDLGQGNPFSKNKLLQRSL